MSAKGEPGLTPLGLAFVEARLLLGLDKPKPIKGQLSFDEASEQ